VLGTAASQSRVGPLALAAGLGLSFTAIGLFVATVGFAIGLDAGVFRQAGAMLLMAIGLVLAAPPLQARVALAAAPIGGWVEERVGSRFQPTGGWGQFGVGLMLGAVWAPCVGPTLGAASVVAARGEDLGAVAATMLAFGIGAALPLLGLGLLSRQTLMRWRGSLAKAGGGLKTTMGIAMIVVGLLVLSGEDKRLEAYLVSISPDWLTSLTTRF
jgi:cytochrome c biogenesis protein CcdA